MANDIKQLLKDHGLTRDEVCRLGNFSRWTLHRIITGTRVLSELERMGIESLPKKGARK